METQNRQYPRLGAGYYWKIWDQFQKKMPSTVDVPYLAFLGDMTPDSINSNVLRHLRLMGLIGDDGKPTDLAWKWRNSETHRGACNEMVTAIYPESVTDAFPEEDTSVESLTKWFSNHARMGESAAKGSARMLSLLRTSDPNSRTVKPSKAPLSSSGKQQRSKGTRSAPSGNGATPDQHQNGNGLNPDDGMDPSYQRRVQVLPNAPSIHLDIQFHLSPDTSKDQIDHLFESMAKHLKGWNAND